MSVVILVLQITVSKVFFFLATSPEHEPGHQGFNLYNCVSQGPSSRTFETILTLSQFGFWIVSALLY